MLQVKLFVQYMYLSVVQKLAKIWCFFRSRLLWVKVVKFFPRLWQTVINQPSVHRGKTRGGSSFIGVQVYIISTCFQNGFLGGGYSKNPVTIWLFFNKSWGLFKKQLKRGLNSSNDSNSSNGMNASNSSKSSNGSDCSNNSNGSNPTLIVTVSLSIHEC